MPVHDWTRVSAGIFHHFHLEWIGDLSRQLNRRVETGTQLESMPSREGAPGGLD